MDIKKLVFTRILKMLLLIIPALLFVLLLPINEFDDSRRIREYLLEEPNSLDVVVMGASDVYAGYSPVLAYDEFGFTGYSYVLSGNHIELIPGQLEEVLHSQSPKLIVIEITELLKYGPYAGVKDTTLRQYLAGVPLSQNKLKMIWEYGDRTDLLSYIIPFMANHGNTDIASIMETVRSRDCVQKRGYSLLKGSLTFTGSGENWDGEYVTPYNTNHDDSRAEIPQDVKENFQYLLTYLKEKGLNNVVFVNFPHRITTEELYTRYQFTNTLGDLIESYGYDFINLERELEAVGIQPETDFYNNAHMNLYGQYKVTRYLCNILKTEYGIGESQLSARNKERWDTCVEYQHLYYQLFDYEFRNRDPEEFGLWLKEDAWLDTRLNELRENGLPAA